MPSRWIRTMAVAGALFAALASAGVAAHSHGGGDGNGKHGDRMMNDRAPMKEAPVGMPGRGMMHGSGMMSGPGMMMGGAGMMGHMASMGGMTPYTAVMLGLSEKQLDQVQQIRDDRMGDYWNLMRQMHGSMRALMLVWSQPDPEPQEVGEMYGRVAQIKRDMIELQTEMRRAIRGVLTAEQRERLDEMRRMHVPERATHPSHGD